ncbi:hypothetical protein POX_c04523 [Penicillium oxalicum]|uniref:Terpene synthase n=1 Tax=Penicillium oxalicum (strain 114-2 / CGMCC 5302) TaxID=933388 RepID=S7Z7J2_PENO1|nr:hypothetical protein POX_c04523 [Penicillium oxalicum]EPS26139.1 hypothetical protein PDE_01075 [Penicillium oxalicum 114-2]KAI2791657.1 hypothetical protein POX_c04523 [Penicillium oxalicum]
MGSIASPLAASTGILETESPHQAFRESLRGQRAIIPKLYDLFPEWSPRFHPDWQKAREDSLNPWLNRWVDEDKIRAKLKAADFAIFASIICAEASFEKLCTVSKFFAWYFVWDDQFDCGSLTFDTEGRAAYQQKSKEYFEHVLLLKGSRPDLSTFTNGQRMALLCWDEIAEHIRKCCSPEVCEIILQTLLPFVGSVDTVDSILKNDTVPTVAQYWERRDLTAAVYPVIATLFFIYGASAHVSSLQDPRLATLWKNTSYIVHITNDMLSMLKEARDGQIEGLVPVLMLNFGLDCATAMQWSFQLAQVQVKGIRAIESSLAKDHDEKDAVSKLLKDVFLEGCKDVAMGLIHWSYHGQRYFRKNDIGDDYVIEFVI